MIRNVFQLKTAAVIYNNKEVGTSSSSQRLLKVAATASRKKLTVKLRPSRGLIQPRLFTTKLALRSCPIVNSLPHQFLKDSNKVK